MRMAKVIVKHSFYDYDTLKPQIFSMMEIFAGDAISSGKKVMIKPNFLAPASPGAAVITHPLVVKAVAEYVIEQGSKPVISDSQAIGSFGRILQTGGFAKELKGLDVEFREFRKSVSVDVGEPFGKIDLAQDALEADFIINLPKLKTHGQMFMTLGVKNMFGCVVGLRKPEWHFRTGVDRELFARLVVQIYETVKPDVTILDGILAMEGQGPGLSGKPRELNVLMGSSDAVALDMAVCRMLALEPNDLLTNRIAFERGLAPEYEIEGELPRINNFRLPMMAPLVFGPAALHSLARRFLVQRPEVTTDKCRMCRECLKYCPAKAITNKSDGLTFDYDKCIRCFCCIEVCPWGALETKENILSRMARRVFRSKT
jgi:uncharacterized protein (DUF362 family)/Pyruvate/2-oxoacid:ferredoxin oxidoreductase delta subunit